MVSCQWLQESSKNQQQQHFIWPRKLAREGKDHLPGVLFASKQGQRNVFLVFIVYAQQPVVKKTGVGFERWLAVGPRRQLGCSFVFVLVHLCLYLVVYLYLWQIFAFVYLCIYASLYLKDSLRLEIVDNQVVARSECHKCPFVKKRSGRLTTGW